MKQSPSQNFDVRADGQNPSYIILHYTGTKTAEEAEARFCNDNPQDQIGRIAPHYMIDGVGQWIKFIEEDKRAWHAGKAQWKDITDMNSASIGIEIWNSGHEFDCEDFLPKQIDSLVELIENIRTRWNIPNANILGHSDIAPGRKIDPGEKFPWRKLEIYGVGLMPDMGDPSSEAEAMVSAPESFYQALRDYGYTYTDDQTVLLREFRRHFLPKLLDNQELDLETCAAILSLARQAA
ncbi:MAG TPA: N-acetylmuramoyl-L-alanine amidase [Alphaproteobacteria bacterium]|nr:N-acetylmuramoyl-L-alanine amidase [Alphaproteobacteria bacterium]HNS44596.1 N-acetylmuramoyl-L-alanine amidase [Alphaproteobacteria bacterium]